MYRNVKKIYLVHQFQQPIPKIWIRIFTKLFCPVSTTTGSGSHVEFCLECWSEKQQTPPIVLYLVMKDMTSNWNVIQFSAEFRYILFKWFVIDILWNFLLKAATNWFSNKEGFWDSIDLVVDSLGKDFTSDFVQVHTVHVQFFFKGGLISESFSLWSFPKKSLSSNFQSKGK